jgi:hypothetical protein
MKRLLFYYPTPFDTLRGGIERVTNKLAKELNKYGYDVFYLHLKNETTLQVNNNLVKVTDSTNTTANNSKGKIIV